MRHLFVVPVGADPRGAARRLRRLQGRAGWSILCRAGPGSKPFPVRTRRKKNLHPYDSINGIENLDPGKIPCVPGDDHAVVRPRDGGDHHIDCTAGTPLPVAFGHEFRPFKRRSRIEGEDASMRPAKRAAGPSAPRNQASSAFRFRPVGKARMPRPTSASVNEAMNSRWSSCTASQSRRRCEGASLVTSLITFVSRR